MIKSIILSRNHELMELVSLVLSGCLEHHVYKVTDFKKAISEIERIKPEIVFFDEEAFYASLNFSNMNNWGSTPLYVLLAGEKHIAYANYVPIPNQKNIFYFITALKNMINASLVIKVKNWVLNIPRKCLIIDEIKEILLSDNEIRILYILMSRSDTVHTNEELLKAAWGKFTIEDVVIDSSTLRKTIQSLRRKIGTNSIVNIRGAGYKIKN